MIPGEILASVNSWLEQTTNSESRVIKHFPIGGGSINSTFRLHTSNGDYFLKYNKATRYPGMFESEAKGLDSLRSTDTITIPKVFLVNTAGDYSYLVMQFIKESSPVNNYWETFADKLAMLHGFKNQFHGFEHDNYIGSLHQDNHQDVDFVNFMVERRLDPLLKKAIDAGLLVREDQKHFERLFGRLINEIPLEEPSLLHGDLWSGNLITDSYGMPCLIDPAVYYGHRELDIAMTLLFGGFNDRFYSRYNEVSPLHKGWRDRVKLFQLYPLLVHVNLFGSSYTNQVRQIIKSF